MSEKDPEISRILQSFPALNTFRTIDAEGGFFRKIHRMLDTFEVFSKLIAVINIQDFISKIEQSNIDTAGLVAFLINKLNTPSLGTWHEFMYRTSNVLAGTDDPFAPGILGLLGFGTTTESRLTCSVSYRAQNITVSNTMDAFSLLTRMRNDYAHGATPNEETCRQDLDSLLPLMKALMNKASFLADYNMNVQTEDDLSMPVVINSQGRRMVVYPFILTQKDGYYFFNDAKLKHKGKLTFLNYTTADKILDSASYQKLRELLPGLDVYENPADFRRQKLLEIVIGRERDAGKIEEQIAKSSESRILYVWGDPGVGKSAMAAYLHENYFSGWVKALHLFFQKDERSMRPESLLKSLYAPLRRAKLVGSMDLHSSNPAEVKQNIDRMLGQASEAAGHAQKRIVIIVDGLDEVSAIGEHVFHALPSTPPPNISIIYLSRRRENLLSRVHSTSAHWMAEYSLGPLDKQAVRAILWQATSKYSLDEQLVDLVYKRSEGNPLYLGHLVNAVLDGDLSLGAETEIPQGMADYYDVLLNKAINKSLEMNLDLPIIDLCLVFSICVEPIDKQRVEAILQGVSPEKISLTIEALLEIIRPLSLKGEKNRYQLFHKSVADCILAQYDQRAEKIRRCVLLSEAGERRAMLESWLDGFLSSETCGRADLENLGALIEHSERFHSIYSVLVQSIVQASKPSLLIKKIFIAGMKAKNTGLERFIGNCLFSLQDTAPDEYIVLMQSLSGQLRSSRFLRRHLVDALSLQRFSEAHYAEILDHVLEALLSFPLAPGPKKKNEYLYFINAIAGWARSFDSFEHLERLCSLLLNLTPEGNRRSGSPDRLEEIVREAAGYLDYAPLKDLVTAVRAKDHKRLITRGNEEPVGLMLNFARLVLGSPGLWLKLMRTCGSFLFFLLKNGLKSMGLVLRRLKLLYNICERAVPLIFTSAENGIINPKGMQMISRLEELVRRRLKEIDLGDRKLYDQLKAEGRQQHSLMLDHFAYLVSIAMVPLFKVWWNYSKIGLQELVSFDEQERGKNIGLLHLLKAEASIAEEDMDLLHGFLSAEDAWRNYFAMVAITIQGNDAFDKGTLILRRMIDENPLALQSGEKQGILRRMRIFRQYFSLFSYLLRRARDASLREEMGEVLVTGLRDLLDEIVKVPQMLPVFVRGSLFGQGDPFNPLLPVGIFCATREHTEDGDNALYRLTDEFIRAIEKNHASFVPDVTHKLLDELLSLSLFYPSMAMRAALHFFDTFRSSNNDLAQIALEKIRLLEIMCPGYLQPALSEWGPDQEKIKREVARFSESRGIDDGLILRISNEIKVFAWHELTTTLMISCPRTRDLVIDSASECFKRPISIAILAESIIRNAATAYFSDEINEELRNLLR